ncbi:MAG: ATP-binding protein [Oceanospirillaceae bacterium]|nr:ATP-binding protein [Oceanospirillaceae bacterium]
MRIHKITLENFKTFTKLEYHANEEFNYIVGENNIGKSTILEAIQLWKVAFDRLIQSNGKKFYGQATPCYLGFESLFFLRLRDLNDIFHSHWKKKLTITLVLIHEEELYPLSIALEKPGIPNSYLRVKYDIEPFNKFRDKILEFGLSLREAIFIYQTRPIFHSVKNEPFYNNAQLLKKISLGKSQESIRNKILKSEKEGNFSSLEARLNNVFNSTFQIRFKNKNRQDEEYVRITIQEVDKKEVELSLLGSGLLQILEIFSTLEFINKKEHCLNVLLIDEPDSHIHSNLQSNLIDELKNNTNYQTFLISHNDRLISKAEEGELFFINKKAIEDKEVKSLPINSYSNVSNELANNLFSLDESQLRKIIILTEGKTDKAIMEMAWQKLNPDIEQPYHIISSGLDANELQRSGNADTVRRTIEFISTITNDLKIVGLFDNDREGNEQFKGLNNKIFESHSNETISRKHISKRIFGLLLPVPEHRSDFVTTNNITQRYFVMEHYFENPILESHNLKGDNILSTNVFEIQGNKTTFSTSLNSLNPADFEHFRILFNELDGLFTEENESS